MMKPPVLSNWMTKRLFLGLVVTLAACAVDEDRHLGDALPKRGALPSDPTIMSVVANCNRFYSHWWIEVEASDLKGTANLLGCQTSVDDKSPIALFNGTSKCVVEFDEECVIGDSKTLDIIVSNASSMATSAMVTRQFVASDSRQ